MSYVDTKTLHAVSETCQEWQLHLTDPTLKALWTQARYNCDLLPSQSPDADLLPEVQLARFLFEKKCDVRSHTHF